MGNNTSKQKIVEPPEEWDPDSNNQRFELVSPMSDLSDPSMFLHRRDPTRPRSSINTTEPPESAKKTELGVMNAAIGAMAGPTNPRHHSVTRQTPAGDRRRTSKVIATRDPAFQHEPRQRDLPPPSSFYFPSATHKRESEDHANRLLTTRRTTSEGRIGDNKENLHNESNAFQKAKENVLRATNCVTGCIADSNHRAQLMKDNAQQRSKYAREGHRLSSEIATKSKATEKVTKRRSCPQPEDFDPSKHKDPAPKSKATAWQFVDGAEKKLSFNPVWRESHEGIINEPSKINEPRRSSLPTTSRVSSANESRRVSDPTSERDRCVMMNKDNDGRRSSTTGTSTLCTASTQAKDSLSSDAILCGRFSDDEAIVILRQEQQAAKNHRASGESNNDDSCATSHESSYWGAFYQDQDAQVLHQEDAYFDRLAYKPSNNEMVKASPMAEQNVAAPVVTLFDREASKSLLGPMDEYQDGSPWHVNNDGEESMEKLFHNNTTKNGTSIEKTETYAMPKDAIHKTFSALSAEEAIHARASGYIASNENSVVSRDNKTSTKTNTSIFQRPRQSLLSATISESDSSVSATTSGRSRPSDENIGTTETPSTGNTASSDLSLLKTEVRKNTRSSMSQETPQTLSVTTESFGSAYSYRDKDVFTPVTASTTYRKGSPFRPRISQPGHAMAKAKVEHPIMFTKSLDGELHSTGNMVIRTTTSAPSTMETRDYRDIAYGSFLQETPNGLARKEKATELARFSPALSVDSVPTPSMNSPSSKPVSDDAFDNAAFLFSPSYAVSNSLLTLPGKPGTGTQIIRAPPPNSTRDSLYSISTLGSRSRSSIASGKSQKISVPKASSTMITLANQKQRTSNGTSIKSVRFFEGASADEEPKSKSAAGTKPGVTRNFSNTHVEIPAIETKVSDLTDIIYKRESVDSTNQGVTPLPIKVVSEAVPETPGGKSDSDGRHEATPEETANWKYCEISKGVTPMLHRKFSAQATNSPVIRFKAAKSKFITTKTDKATPVKKSENFKRKVAGALASRIAVFDNGGGPVQPKVVVSMCYSKDSRSEKSSTRDSTSSRSTTTTTSTTVVTVPVDKSKRTSSLLSITLRAQKDSSEIAVVPSDEEYDDRSCDSSDVGDSSVATLVRKDRVDRFVRFTDANIVEGDPPQGCDNTPPEMEGDDIFDDILGDLMGNNYCSETEEDTVATVPQKKDTQSSLFGRPSMRSIVSEDDDESSSMTDIFTIARSFSEESTSMSSYLANTKPGNLRFSCAPVKVDEQAQHQHTQPGSLFLSPTQRTPMQAKKWRQLADEAKKSEKKNLFRSKNPTRKGKALSERNANVVSSKRYDL